MNELIVFPDAIELVVNELRAELPAYGFGDATVITRIPSTRPEVLVLVRRLGGTRLNLVTDEPLIGVECWAPELEEAHDLAQMCRALVLALQGTTSGGVPVYRVTEAGGLIDLPDPLSSQPRFTFTAAIAVRGDVAHAS